VVVNYSRGNSAGPHDGSSDYDLDLAALLGPGRLLVTAGGNEADKDGHTDNDGGAAANGASVTRGFIVPAGNAGVEIAVWFTAANDAAIGVSYPAAGKTLTALPVRDGVTGQIWLIGAEMYVVTVQNYKAVPNLPNDRTALVMISSLGIPSGVATNWELTFQNRAAPGVAADGHFDAYILKGATFIVPSAEETITDPGNGRQVVTVGAFIHRDANPANDGTLAPFSSQGPTRDISTNLAGAAGRPGRRKPDISAPGRRVIMPRSNSAPVAIWAGNANYTQASGTSFAAPHMTGCAAIMLTRNAALAPADLLRWLPWFSRTDPAVVAGNAWGEGKLWCGADWDGDGVPLLVEDANLNGVVDPLETSDELEDSDGDGLPDLSQQWLLHSVLPH
jgi:hypothetical protein